MAGKYFPNVTGEELLTLDALASSGAPWAEVWSGWEGSAKEADAYEAWADFRAFYGKPVPPYPGEL